MNNLGLGFETWYIPLAITIACVVFAIFSYQRLLIKQVSGVTSTLLLAVLLFIASIVSGVSWLIWGVFNIKLETAPGAIAFLISITAFVLANIVNARLIKVDKKLLSENEQLFNYFFDIFSGVLFLSIIISFFLLPVWVSLSTVVIIFMPYLLSKLFSNKHITMPFALGVAFIIISAISYSISLLQILGFVNF